MTRHERDRVRPLIDRQSTNTIVLMHCLEHLQPLTTTRTTSLTVSLPHSLLPHWLSVWSCV